MLALFINSAYAAATPAQPNTLLQILPMVAIFAIFYFLIIRPQSKQRKQHRAMVDGLTVGNEVVFAGGLMGKITKIEGDYATVALNPTNLIKVQRASVISVLPAGTIDNI